MYTAFSLNGTWNMAYEEAPYLGQECPRGVSTRIPQAVPGYWEEMGEKFQKTSFYRALRINPEYGIQAYPIAERTPDMALPNIVGNFFYSRTFTCKDFGDMPAAFYFGGVQNAVSVWLNGQYLGRHEGYSAPFCLPIPAGVLQDGENEVTLSVSNHRLTGFDGQPVSGITSRAASECTGGITGDVQLRIYHSPLRDAAICVSKDLERVFVTVDAASPVDIRWQVFDGDALLAGGDSRGDFSFCAKGLRHWSPEEPYLYTLRIECGEAVCQRQFGVRALVPDGAQFRFNGSPYYLRGVCEHCYYPETVHPTNDIGFYRRVIKKLKELGFNFIRFHTHIPPEAYMQAADELGMILHVETPNNTAFEEWLDIIRFCRRHPSVLIYCGGNELYLYDRYISHLNRCADAVHRMTDSLFSPMSALRGVEYGLVEGDMPEAANEPFQHHPRRLQEVGAYSDLYSSYAQGHFSYFSMTGDSEEVSAWHQVYGKPRLTHEISLAGTYTDLSIKDRYRSSPIGKTNMFPSIEAHLADKKVLDKAPLYFRNSCQWQWRTRKYCFELVRRCENMAGFDFLGPIDTHWHTFGYDVGMMNEFYELKPGESVRNVRMYNSETVLLQDLGLKTNFTSGGDLACGIYVSYFGKLPLTDGELTVRLFVGGKPAARRRVRVDLLHPGQVRKIYDLSLTLPTAEKAQEMHLAVSLEGEGLYAENEWELYLFPKTSEIDTGNLLVVEEIGEDALCAALEAGRDVVLLGTGPFPSNETTARVTLAGRAIRHSATVIADHPAVRDLPHHGYCAWQFAQMLEGGKAVILESDSVPFDAIIEMVSPHKNVIRQAALFEYRVGSGRLLVCSLHLASDDPGAVWLRSELLSYAKSCRFSPAEKISIQELRSLIHGEVTTGGPESNIAFNPNDRTAVLPKGR